MKTAMLSFLIPGLLVSGLLAQQPKLLLVVGEPGTQEYKTKFDAQAAAWKEAAGDHYDFRILHKKTELANELETIETDLWLVLLGHGTDDGKHARFNLNGPDLSPDELKNWLAPITNQTVIINCSAASGAFIKSLAAPNRIVITATRSGTETSFSYFGTFLTQALVEREAADLDKDHGLSALEAFLYASRRVTEFYEADGRIQTETALIDDNGDGKGMQADWFRGSRPDQGRIKKGKPDGYAAMQQPLLGSSEDNQLTPEQRAERNKLEQELFALREQREELGEKAYFDQLEVVLQKLGAFYR
jgi:hypothetical protein